MVKKDTHPPVFPVAYYDEAVDKYFFATSTQKPDTTETKKHNGVDYFVLRIEISSESHPFFTGKQKLLDTSGRVERFKKMQEKASAA